ncbi:glycosyl hydrolase family 28-related protein [Winogradskya humida]|uniref:Mycodextranase n=1 Tax=Winogradskya humida TaxID=113566 RepID=A0ABQ3ZZ44_9ACTN|nr:glycosyl hydrolase family 28-related protein [Actinoplanes humidus]GIE23739.1 mycodextranase [Actinoplanes humidus]
MSFHGEGPGAPARHRRARRRATTGVAVLGAAAVVAAGLSLSSWWSSPSADAATTASTAATTAASPFAVDGRGARVPFTELEAEDAATNGTVLAPDRRYGTLATEASGRRAVTLDAAGEYVEFTLTAPADAMSFRYSVPDNAAGTGRTASVDVQAGGNSIAVGVTSRYAFYYGSFPFTNTPGTGAHHFYDETRTMFGQTLPAGSTVRVELASTAQTPSITVDLADFELVGAPVAKPAGALDVVADFGADPTGSVDATAKFQAAVDAGRTQGRAVFVPRGNFLLFGHVTVDKVTVQGAGPWYSVLGGRDPGDRSRAAGLFGRYAGAGGAPSTDVTIRDLAIIGDITERDDSAPTNAIGGSLTDSVVDNVWLQHTKVGLWLDGVTTNFTLRNSRILDQTADGVNFHRGITGSTVENTFVRNTGDDGLAMWSQTNVDAGNTFRDNTVVAPMLANAIAVYGGTDITVTDNVVADTIVSGGGVHVGNRFDDVSGPTAVAGTFTLARNTLIRTGSPSEWESGIGALWFDALNAPLTGASIKVSDTDIIDSTYAAVQTVEGSAVTGLDLDGVRIAGAGTYALLFQTAGAATLSGVTVTGAAQSPPVYRCGTGFTITAGAGNSGWSSDATTCPPTWPAPQ